MFPHDALFSATTQDWRQSRWQPETIFNLFLNISMKDKLKEEMLLSWDAGGNKWKKKKKSPWFYCPNDGRYNLKVGQDKILHYKK